MNLKTNQKNVISLDITNIKVCKSGMEKLNLIQNTIGKIYEKNTTNARSSRNLLGKF